MAWWQIGLIFVGIPSSLFVMIAVVVLSFTSDRVPDGIARQVALDEGRAGAVNRSGGDDDRADT